MQFQIEDLNKRREEFLQIREDSWNPKTDKYEVDNKEIDKLSKEIIFLIKEHRNELTLEFIFEQLTKLGYTPNLLYDDNGRFAIVSDSFQSLPDDEPSDINLHFFVSTEHWKKSIKEALNYYLDTK
jgi:hypothetical protein